MRRFGLVLLLIGVLTQVSGCGGDGRKATGACTEDDECGGGVCFEQTCYSACTSTSVCASDEFCVRKDAGARSVDICVVAAAHVGCTTDAQCADLVAGACEAVSCDEERGLCRVDALPGTDCGTQPDPDARDVLEPDTTGPDVPAGDTAVVDTAPTDTSLPPVDTAEPDPGQPDQAVEDQAQADQSVPTDPYGFAIRVPQERTFPCNTGADGVTNVSYWDADWVCNVSPGGEQERFIYVRSTPDHCGPDAPYPPVFVTKGAWTSTGGTVSVLTYAQYAWGDDGFEVNDSLSYFLEGSTYKLSHSSVDAQGQACQPMDCAQLWTDAVFDFLPLDLVLSDDGCTATRSRPVICRKVKEDGSYDALVDSFVDCSPEL